MKEAEAIIMEMILKILQKTEEHRWIWMAPAVSVILNTKLCLLEEIDKDRKGFFTLENNFQGLKKKILPFASVLIT